MGETTTLTKAATNTTSLRTTVPASIVKQFKLSDRDKLDWSIDIQDGKMVVLVRPEAMISGQTD